MLPPEITSLDHLVLTVSSIEKTTAFYKRVLGMRAEVFVAADKSERWALYFGNQKINLHQKGQEFEPKAHKATAGSADLCFLTVQTIDAWQQHLDRIGVAIIEGPVARSGATGPILSVYLRDPDLNLIEIAAKAGVSGLK